MVSSEHKVTCMHHSILNVNNRWRTAVSLMLVTSTPEIEHPVTTTHTPNPGMPVTSGNIYPYSSKSHITHEESR